MVKHNIHIINFKVLFDILEEIKKNLSFEIYHYIDKKKIYIFFN